MSIGYLYLLWLTLTVFIFCFQYIHNFNAFIAIWMLLWIVIWLHSICVVVANVLSIKCRSLHLLLIVVIYFYFLLHIVIQWCCFVLVAHYRCNLFLRTLCKFLNLALSLMFNRIISTLYTRWVYWYVTATWILLVPTSYLHPRLRSRWAWAWSSYLTSISLLGLFYISTLDILIFNFIIISPPSITSCFFNDYTKFFKLV